MEAFTRAGPGRRLVPILPHPRSVRQPPPSSVVFGSVSRTRSADSVPYSTARRRRSRQGAVLAHALGLTPAPVGGRADVASEILSARIQEDGYDGVAVQKSGCTPVQRGRDADSACTGLRNASRKAWRAKPEVAISNGRCWLSELWCNAIISGKTSRCIACRWAVLANH